MPKALSRALLAFAGACCSGSAARLAAAVLETLAVALNTLVVHGVATPSGSTACAKCLPAILWNVTGCTLSETVPCCYYWIVTDCQQKACSKLSRWHPAVSQAPQRDDPRIASINEVWQCCAAESCAMSSLEPLPGLLPSHVFLAASCCIQLRHFATLGFKPLSSKSSFLASTRTAGFVAVCKACTEGICGQDPDGLSRMPRAARRQ